jgi:hypothetical protein
MNREGDMCSICMVFGIHFLGWVALGWFLDNFLGSVCGKHDWKLSFHVFFWSGWDI